MKPKLFNFNAFKTPPKHPFPTSTQDQSILNERRNTNNKEEDVLLKMGMASVVDSIKELERDVFQKPKR